MVAWLVLQHKARRGKPEHQEMVCLFGRRTGNLKRICFGLAVSILLVAASAALANPITCTFTGRGSGTLGGMPFANEAFTIKTVADTSQRHGEDSVWSINSQSAEITIGALGTYDILSSTRVFCSNEISAVGFARLGPDLFDLFSVPGMATWNMLSSVGPVSTTQATLLQWSRFDPVTTSGGVLIFNDQDGINSTFTATVVPEPSALISLLCALSAAAGTLKLRRS